MENLTKQMIIEEEIDNKQKNIAEQEKVTKNELDFSKKKKAKIQAKNLTEKNEYVNPTKENPDEQIKIMFPSLSEDKIKEVLQRTGNNIEEGIELFKLFLNQGDSIMTNSTANKRKKRNYASTMNVIENTAPQNTIVREKPDSNLIVSNQFEKQENKDDNMINKEVLPKITENDTEKIEDGVVNSTKLKEITEEYNEPIQKLKEEPKIFEDKPQNYDSIPKNEDVQLPETENHSQVIDTNNGSGNNNDNYQNYFPEKKEEKNPLMEKILDKTINDLSKCTSKDQLRQYLENLITSPNSEKEIESKKQQFLTLHNNNKTLRMGIEVLFKKYDEIKKKNEKQKQKIEEMSSSIGNLHGVLTNETIKKEKLLAQLNEYSQQNVSNVLPSNEGY